MIKKFYRQNICSDFKINGYIEHNKEPFTGIKEYIREENTTFFHTSFVNGFYHGISYSYNFDKHIGYISIIKFNERRFSFGYSLNENNTIYNSYDLCYDFISFDNFRFINGENIEQLNFKILLNRNDLDYEELILSNQDIIDKYHSYDEDGSIDLDTFVYTHGDVERYSKVIVAYDIHNKMKSYLGKTIPDTFMEKFVWQEEQIEKIIKEDKLPTVIQFIGGVSVAYHDISKKMVAVVTVMNVDSQEIVDQAVYTEDKINMHIPDIFGFNETVWTIKAFEKLSIKPQLVFCDGHGIEHPKNMGFATFLGIQLDIPTIGCAKKRLVGYCKKEDLSYNRADFLELIFDTKVVGKAIRTQENLNPVYVSLGHKISLETSVDWVLKTTQTTRLPLVLEKAIEIARENLPEQFRIDFMNDEPNEYGILK